MINNNNINYMNNNLINTVAHLLECAMYGRQYTNDPKFIIESNTYLLSIGCNFQFGLHRNGVVDIVNLYTFVEDLEFLREQTQDPRQKKFLEDCWRTAVTRELQVGIFN